MGKNKTNHHPFDVCATHYLHKHLRANRLTHRPTKLDVWATQFRLLREADGVPPRRIRTVLKWYVRNLMGTYIPKAHSAAGFRKKFLAIERAMHRASGIYVGSNEERY